MNTDVHTKTAIPRHVVVIIGQEGSGLDDGIGGNGVNVKLDQRSLSTEVRNGANIHVSPRPPVVGSR